MTLSASGLLLNCSTLQCFRRSYQALCLPTKGCRISLCKPDLPCGTQVAKISAAHELASQQLAASEAALKERSDQLGQTAAGLEAKEAELARLSHQHEALIMQHERSEADLSDLTGVLRAKQKDAEGLQARRGTTLPHSPSHTAAIQN